MDSGHAAFECELAVGHFIGMGRMTLKSFSFYGTVGAQATETLGAVSRLWVCGFDGPLVRGRGPSVAKAMLGLIEAIPAAAPRPRVQLWD